MYPAPLLGALIWIAGTLVLQSANAPAIPVNSNATDPVSVPPDEGNFVPSATVMLADPSKGTPLIVRGVVSLVAVAAFPVMLTPV